MLKRAAEEVSARSSSRRSTRASSSTRPRSRARRAPADAAEPAHARGRAPPRPGRLRGAGSAAASLDGAASARSRARGRAIAQRPDAAPLGRCTCRSSWARASSACSPSATRSRARFGEDDLDAAGASSRARRPPRSPTRSTSSASAGSPARSRAASCRSRCPEVAGFEVGLLYEPAASQADGRRRLRRLAAARRRGRVLVGDVAGKGVETAALSSMVALLHRGAQLGHATARRGARAGQHDARRAGCRSDTLRDRVPRPPLARGLRYATPGTCRRCSRPRRRGPASRAAAGCRWGRGARRLRGPASCDSARRPGVRATPTACWRRAARARCSAWSACARLVAASRRDAARRGARARRARRGRAPGRTGLTDDAVALALRRLR